MPTGLAALQARAAGPRAVAGGPATRAGPRAATPDGSRRRPGPPRDAIACWTRPATARPVGRASPTEATTAVDEGQQQGSSHPATLLGHRRGSRRTSEVPVDHRDVRRRPVDAHVGTSARPHRPAARTRQAAWSPGQSRLSRLDRLVQHLVPLAEREPHQGRGPRPRRRGRPTPARPRPRPGRAARGRTPVRRPHPAARRRRRRSTSRPARTPRARPTAARPRAGRAWPPASRPARHTRRRRARGRPRRRAGTGPSRRR